MSMQLNDDALRNPVISIVISLLERVGAQFAKAEVRARLSSRATYPRLTLADVADALDDWSIEFQAVELLVDMIDLLPLPALVPLKETGIDKGVIFALVTSINRQAVCIVHPILGGVTLSRSRFKLDWNGIALCVNLAQERILSSTHALEEETNSGRAYRDSIIFVDDVISRKDCLAIIKHCEDMDLFCDSEISTDGMGYVGIATLGRSRTSSSAFIQPDETPHVTNLCEAVAHMLGVPNSGFEALQCARYRSGQEFKPHFDAGPSVARTKTAIVYLNEDFEGGATWFPELKFEVHPKRGSCLAFDNLTAEGFLIPQSLHAGLPVTSGIKYVCNVWVRLDANA